MATHHLDLPLTKATVQGLRLGDIVYLTGDIVITAGIPTHKRIVESIESGDTLPIDMSGAAFFHLGSYSIDKGDGTIDIRYMNPTTSTRFNDVMPRIISHFDLRAVGGKGGLDRHCAGAMAEVGCVYLSFLGGGAQLHTAAIRTVREVAWEDLIAHYRLVRLSVERLGPLTVGIDAHGNNLFDNLTKNAKDAKVGILQTLANSHKEV